MPDFFHSSSTGRNLLAGLQARRAIARVVPTTDGSPRNVLAGGGPLDHAAFANSTLVEVQSGNATKISGGSL